MGDRGGRPDWGHAHSTGLPHIHPSYIPALEEPSSSMPVSSSNISFGLPPATFTPSLFRPESSYQSNMIPPASRNQFVDSFGSYHPAFSTSLQGQGFLTTPPTRQTNFPLHQMVMPGGHHMDNRNGIMDAMAAAHRVMDSTVSHSGHRGHSAPLQDRRHSNQHMSEVTTTGHLHAEVDVLPLPAHRPSAGPPQVDGIESTVSSIGSSMGGSTADDLRDARMNQTHNKQERPRSHKDRIVMPGEPDTTQDDEDEYNRVADKAMYNNTAPHLMLKQVSRHSDQNYGMSLPSSTPIPAPMSTNLDYSMGMDDLLKGDIDVFKSEIQKLENNASGQANAMASSMASSMTSSMASSMADFLMTEEPSREETPTPTTSSSQIGGTSFSIFSSMRRKSSRLNEQDDNPMWKKASYIAKSYDPNQLWCEDCMTTYDNECIMHKLIPLPDRVVFSRAWASLPQGLQIFRLGEKEGSIELGVFAKRSISKYTQFGPFVADIVNSREKLSCTKFPLMVEKDNGSVAYYETSDENKCNWMMFVRPAEKFGEQNLVAYQYGQDIYFTVTRQIEIKQELKVWYAVHYAARVGQQPLRVTEEDLKAIEEQQNKFQCYECPKRFKSAAALQKHLSVHDEGDEDHIKTDSDTEDPSGNLVDRAEMKRRRNLISQNIIRKRMQSVKKLKDVIAENGSATSNAYHWKKRSTNIYLNKTLRKYQKRHDEAMRRTLKSMYRNKQNMDHDLDDPDDQDPEPELDPDDKHIWTCKSCTLTFDNANLLNLHTLTHAAEDVGLEEVRRFAEMSAFPGTDFFGSADLNSLGIMPGMNPQGSMQSMNTEPLSLTCPVCSITFQNKNDLIQHASGHGKAREAKLLSDPRPHKCDVCWKAFSNMERLIKHQMCHGDEENKPMQCPICFKRFMNNSAISCHMKTHSQNKYYECPICHQGFDQTSAIREHSMVHINPDGMFNCPHCEKRFAEFLVLKKHVRGFHMNQSYPCPECDKVFPRMDKLRLHSLKHSSVRECQCEMCGRLFKRMDKLREHNKRMHSVEREEKERLKALTAKPKKFLPKVPATEFHRFIYKCVICMLGFKRRGMLVNHIAKRHPEVKPGSVPELNLPILKTQRDYYCQYCDKVYKSSSKRKTHILKNHPGADLPLSSRKKTCLDDIPGIPNPTYSQTVGSITTMPHQCEYCHKQYASKAKLLQHYRRSHVDKITITPEMLKAHAADIAQQVADQVSKATVTVQESETNEEEAVTVAAQEAASQAQDLLTQAMSELTQSLHEFRAQGTATTTTNIDSVLLQTRLSQQVPATLVRIETTNVATAPLDLVHISQALQQFAPSSASLQGRASSVGHEIQMQALTADTSEACVVSTDAENRQATSLKEEHEPTQSDQGWSNYT